MSNQNLFGMSIQEVKRQLSAREGGFDCDPESEYGPINKSDGLLDPCIRGGKKILADPEKREMVKKILTHTNE